LLLEIVFRRREREEVVMEMVVGERERAKEADKPRETEKLTEMATARDRERSV